MRISALCLVAAGLAALPMAQASAYGVSQIHFSINRNSPMPDCHQRARDVLERAGLRVLGTGNASVGAEPQDGQTLATIYCIPSAGVVVATVAGENTAATAPVLERIREAWNGQVSGGGQPGGGQLGGGQPGGGTPGGGGPRVVK
ncbi:MAG TPA: hypothetical protein VGM87_17990 [Roseomonas sp.]|jgi:uncharacterized membrane protein YgcG